MVVVVVVGMVVVMVVVVVVGMVVVMVMVVVVGMVVVMVVVPTYSGQGEGQLCPSGLIKTL